VPKVFNIFAVFIIASFDGSLKTLTIIVIGFFFLVVVSHIVVSTP